MVCLSHYSSEMPLSSAVGCETWSLIWEWGSLTAIITGAPSSSLAESSSSAFPGLGALLGTLPVVRLRDGAVLIIWVSSSVLGPVSTAWAGATSLRPFVSSFPGSQSTQKGPFLGQVLLWVEHPVGTPVPVNATRSIAWMCVCAPL